MKGKRRVGHIDEIVVGSPDDSQHVTADCARVVNHDLAGECAELDVVLIRARHAIQKQRWPSGRSNYEVIVASSADNRGVTAIHEDLVIAVARIDH